MMNPTRFLVLASFPLMLAACDPALVVDADDDELRALSELPSTLFQPYHGRWEGLAVQVDGQTNYDYEATIQLAPGICTIDGVDVYTAQWDYFHLGITCTSELSLQGMASTMDGYTRWYFSDTNVSGPCTDGLVSLTETDDPDVMWHTWQDINGVLDAEGEVTQVAICGVSTGED
ncbi:hypothetical protein G6O69_06490 [Pseudenhygromyxa sp. WMMC2535]|uniref:hypothetical protein n=1 Tax=Pseudenhygromyxa sp. WMMC2535 TaxID=2712867 RepID=UPI001554E7B6|nr:hypothetical protein [Pseudenhygromyxa sp. WMMC2535]NVB37473.1 hypothetical protein [Pseudenhygromyxa sp. WMMC2535]